MKKFADAPVIPPAPGTAPIPEGTMRFFHYTSPEALPSIQQQGLLYDKGRGDSGTGVNEPSKGVWASSECPPRDTFQNRPVVEYWAHPEQLSYNAEHYWDRDPVQWASSGRHHVIMKGDVPPEQFAAVHEPWHQHYRYLMENYPTPDAKHLDSPNMFDWTLDPQKGGDPALAQAVQAWKDTLWPGQYPEQPKTAAVDPSHVANILDAIHETLDVRVFDDPASLQPILKPELQAWITSQVFEVLTRYGYDNPDKWLTLVLTGSLTTYQYSDKSDVDISLFVDTKKFPDWSRAEMIAIMVNNLDGTKLPGTPHPLQCYVVPHDIKPKDLYREDLRSGFVIFGKGQGKWIVPPNRERVHDVEHEMNDAYTVGLLACDKLSLLIKYEPQEAVRFYDRLHASRRADEAAGKGDFTSSNIAYKMIENRGLDEAVRALNGTHTSKTAVYYDDEADEFAAPDFDELDPYNQTLLHEGSEKAMAHTGQTPGDERYVGPVENLRTNPYQGTHPSWKGTVNGNPVYIKNEGEFHENSLANERAAFLVGRAMGVNVPHTIAREVPETADYQAVNNPRSIISHEVTGRNLAELGHDYEDVVKNWPEDARRISLFDSVINSGDRNRGNLLVGQDGKLHAIDHGDSFETGFLGGPLQHALAGSPLTPDEVEALKNALKLAPSLHGVGLPKAQVADMKRRIAHMLSDKTHYSALDSE